MEYEVVYYDDEGVMDSLTFSKFIKARSYAARQDKLGNTKVRIKAFDEHDQSGEWEYINGKLVKTL